MMLTPLQLQASQYWDIRELVCPHTYALHGQNAWRFLNPMFLEHILWLRRDVHKRPMISNTYHRGGKYTQRGVRCNKCQLVIDANNTGLVYLSFHRLAQALDYTVVGLTAEEARNEIREKQYSAPHPFRLERDKSWVHTDICDYGVQLYEFNG